MQSAMMAGLKYLLNNSNYSKEDKAVEYAYNCQFEKAFNIAAGEPRTYKEAMTQLNAAQWHEVALKKL